MPRTRPPYAPEFRAQMVELVRAADRRESWPGSSSRRSTRSANGCNKQTGMRGAERMGRRQMRRRRFGACAGRSGS